MAKVFYPKTNTDKAKLYLHCMVEIKLRIRAIEAILSSDALPLFKHETGNLHLRHICELIAIACLAAQGDYDTQRAFTESYSPPKIFDALRKIYPAFFPQPIDVILGADGTRQILANEKPGAYNEQQVRNVWNQSGDALHRASVQKYLTKTFAPAPSLDGIYDHLHGIATLLEGHLIVIQDHPDRAEMLQVGLQGAEGETWAAFVTIWTDGRMEIEQYRSSAI